MSTERVELRRIERAEKNWEKNANIRLSLCDVNNLTAQQKSIYHILLNKRRPIHALSPAPTPTFAVYTGVHQNIDLNLANKNTVVKTEMPDNVIYLQNKYTEHS